MSLIPLDSEPSAEDTAEARRVARHIVRECLRSGCGYGLQFSNQQVAAIIAWQVAVVLRQSGLDRRYQMTVEHAGNTWTVLAMEREEETTHE